MASKAPPRPTEMRSSRRRLARWQQEQRKARTALIFGIVAVLVILAIPAYGYYATFIKPPREWVVQVNDRIFTMGYLVKLLRMYQRGTELTGQNPNLGTMPFQIVQVISENELVRQVAPRYNITVSKEDIDQEVRRRILGTRPPNDTTPPDQLEREFRERYRQYLTAIRLSEQEHRQLVEWDLYRERMRDYLGQTIPTVQPQVRLSRLTVPTQDKAREVVQRFREGQPFPKLVNEYSIDDEEVRKEGDIGWVVKGIHTDLDEKIICPPEPGSNRETEMPGLFAGIQPGTLLCPQMRPTGPEGQNVWQVYLVTEVASAREVDSQQREILKTRALEKWLSEERPKHIVRLNFDSEKYAWVVKQLRIASTPTGQTTR
ncbi:MAG: SurA N-terminal domain-containing protein [Dehalococcoidia bacterium]|nr:SurA N-terminal domain-containing protein [Dehalococcoidia bacterium]MDW8120058.1 SurA N-terminal domain-containing protein [Chloroflexota bacterium]